MKKAMKKRLLGCLCIVCSFALYGCFKNDNPNEDDNSNQGIEGDTGSDNDTTNSEVVKVTFLVTNPHESQTDVYPSLFFGCGGWTGVQIRNPKSNNDYVAFQMIEDRNYGASVLLVGGKESVSFVDFDIQTGKASNEVLTVSLLGDEIRFTSQTVDWDTSEFVVTGLHQESFPQDDSSTRTSTSSRSDFEDDIAESFCKTMERLGDYISVGGHSLSGTPKAITELWSKVVIPITMFHVYDYDPAKQNEIREQELVGQEFDFVVSLMPEPIQYAWEKWDLLRRMRRLFFSDDTDDEEKPEVTEEDQQLGWGIFQNYPVYTGLTYTESQLTGEMPYTFDVSVQLLSKTKTTASIKADYKQVGPSQSIVSSMGILYGKSRSNLTELSVNGFPYTLSLKDLEPGTEYYVRAYLKSLGITYVSELTFTTDPVFSVSPQTLRFTQDGGSKGVSVDMVDGVETWSIIEKPEWCKIEKGDHSFFVDVEASDTERSGQIVVVGEHKGGEKESIIVTVIQEYEILKYIKFKLSGKKTVRHQMWIGDDYYSESEEEWDESGSAYLTRYANQKDIIHLSCYPASFFDWIVGEGIPDFYGDQVVSFTLSAHDEKTISFEGKNLVPNDVYDWSETYRVSITDLDTMSPHISVQAQSIMKDGGNEGGLGPWHSISTFSYSYSGGAYYYDDYKWSTRASENNTPFQDMMIDNPNGYLDVYREMQRKQHEMEKESFKKAFMQFNE